MQKADIEVLLKGTGWYWSLKRGWKRQVCAVLGENQSWLWIGGNFSGGNLSIFYLSGCQWKLIWWSISIRVTAEHDGKGQIFFLKIFLLLFCCVQNLRHLFFSQPLHRSETRHNVHKTFVVKLSSFHLSILYLIPFLLRRLFDSFTWIFSLTTLPAILVKHSDHLMCSFPQSSLIMQ